MGSKLESNRKTDEIMLLFCVQRVDMALANYDFHQATEVLYQFLYAQLCDVYVEAVKPARRTERAAGVLAQCLDVSLRCLAPFMPFLAEELYQRLHAQLETRGVRNLQRWPSVTVAQFPCPRQVRPGLIPLLISLKFDRADQF